MASSTGKRGLLAWLRREGAVEPAEAEAARETATVESGEPVAVLTERYRDLGAVGHGVRRVYDRNLLRTVAMKLLDPEAAARRGEHDRFTEEAQITGQLDHPNIPPVYEIGADDEGTHYFTMRYVRGQTFEQILGADFRLGDERQLFAALQTFVKACDAVSFAHSRGVLHCDLNPGNLMVGRHGEVYVMDWGVARLRAGPRPSGAETQAVALRRADDERADELKVARSTGYMAPELVASKDIDERSDVFALGAILCRVLTGKQPNAAALLQQPAAVPAGAAKGAALPPRLVAVAAKAMAREPSARYDSVEALKADVEGYMSGAGRAEQATFKRGQVVVREGEAGRAAYAIERGRCVAYKVVDGKKQTLREMGPGEIFGEMAILTAEPRTATVEALDELTVRVITAEALSQELDQTFYLGHLIGLLAARFNEVDSRSSDLRSERDSLRADRDALRLREAALAHLATGRREQGRSVAAWGVLAHELNQRFGCSEAQALAVVTRIPGVAVSAAKDEISLAPLMV